MECCLLLTVTLRARDCRMGACKGKAHLCMIGRGECRRSEALLGVAARAVIPIDRFECPFVSIGMTVRTLLVREPVGFLPRLVALLAGDERVSPFQNETGDGMIKGRSRNDVPARGRMARLALLLREVLLMRG